MWLILALLLNPHAQQQAHGELDRVVGHDRVPNFGDYDELVYIRALVKEIFRWRPITGIGMRLYTGIKPILNHPKFRFIPRLVTTFMMDTIFHETRHALLILGKSVSYPSSLLTTYLGV
jgi:hypothetical protein